MTSMSPADPRPSPIPSTAVAAGAATPPRLQHESSLSSPLHSRPVDPPSNSRKHGESGVYNSSDEHSIDERPTKKCKLSTDGSSGPGGTAAAVKMTLVDDYRFLSALVRESVAAEDDSHASADLPPLPHRPWKLASTVKSEEESLPTHRARSPVPVPTTPDTGYSADGVPKFSNQKPIAYFAWTGKHAEDNLSTENVKSGYFDRPPNPPEKETNTARVPMYNALKHHHGIGTLSTLFTLVLEAKNKHCLITSATAFKPPPRVTLAEAKRKSWIADLADATVPLRKLSRTIPQGIRGQGLLDQCIHNKVPLSRAIWFAKCVGANEIRTLKRKGTTPQAAVGTETKWIREWTVNVEQFVENIVLQADQPNWKTNFQYALRLATRLYLENLLDRDHYLDWLLKSFVLSQTEQLPSWLLVVHIYMQDLVKFRKRGRPLAHLLLTKYTKMKELPSSLAQSLTKKLKDVIRHIALLQSSCFLMPDQWPDVRDAFQSCLDLGNTTDMSTLAHLEIINVRCMGANKSLYLTKMSDKDKVIKILDQTRLPANLLSLSHALLGACPDRQKLATYCLEWATTKFRTGSARVYLTSRLLRRWLRQGHDLDAAIVRFFDQAAISLSGKQPDDVRHIFSDLSRSNSFSVSKWLQAMNVRGLPYQNTVNTKAIITTSGISLQQQWADGGTALLMDLSLPKCSGHIVNLRNTLLDRAGYSLDSQMEAVRNIVAELKQKLARLDSSDRLDATFQNSTKLLLTGWNWIVRNQVSHWLRGFVSEVVKTRTQMSLPMSVPVPVLNKDDDQSSTHSLGQAHFSLIRIALETLDEEPVLADIVDLFSSINCEQVQVSLVETISRHAAAFSAIGALEPLQVKLIQTYMSLRTVKATMPLFATALLELCADNPTRATFAKFLQQDLIRGDRGRAMAACSPFSDGVAESLQHAEATFVDDFEAVLQSEPCMSEQAMSRLFGLLTERIEKQQGTIVGEDALFSYCQLMARLRFCGRIMNDQLLKAWLVKALSKYASTFTRNLVLTLIGTGCLTIDLLVEAVSVIGIATVLAHHSWLLSSRSIPDHVYGYVTATKWIDFSRRKPNEALNLIGYASQPDRDRYEMPVCIDLVQDSSIDITSLPASSRVRLEKNLSSLLDIENTSELTIRSALVNLDGFSTPFVQAQLRLLSNTNTLEESSAIATAICELVNDPEQPISTVQRIPIVLQAAEGELATQVRQIAEDTVLNMLPRIGTGRSPDGLLLEPKANATLSQAVEQAFQLCSVASSPSPRSSQRLVDLLSQILKFLKSYNPGTTVPKTPTTVTSPSSNTLPMQQPLQQSNSSGQIIPALSSPRDGFVLAPASILEYLRIILKLLCLQRPSSSSTSGYTVSSASPLPKQSSDGIRVLVHLAAIITHHELISALDDSDGALSSLAKEVIDFGYDVMATYVDEVGDEGRQLLIKLLRDKLKYGNDLRLKFLFGSVSTCGSDMPGGEELGKGLFIVKRDSDGLPKGKILGEWRPKVWEVLETGGRNDTDVSIGLGLFGARRI